MTAVAIPPADMVSAAMRAADAYQVPVRLLLGVAWVESEFHRDARNTETGAAGAWQLKPATQRSLGVTDPYDVDEAAHGAAKFLRVEYDRFVAGRAPVAGWRIALAAFRWGSERVAAHPLPSEWPAWLVKYADDVRRAADAVPLPKDVDILIISGPERSSQASRLLHPGSMPLDGLRRRFARSLQGRRGLGAV